MSEFSQYVLDLLGEIGGGRGDPADDLSRFTLGLIFWLMLIGTAVTIRLLHPTRKVSLMLIGMSLGASRELLMLVSHSLNLYGVVAESTLHSFVPPLDHGLLLTSRIIIASAFLSYRLDDSTVARLFLRAGVAIAVILTLALSVAWQSTLSTVPQLHFDEFFGGWLIHGWGLLTMCLAILLLAMSGGVRTHIVCIPFAFFLLDDLLSMINMASAELHTLTLTPIAQTCHILALPWFGYLYWREQIDEQTRLSAKLVESERLEVVGQLAAGIAHDFNNHLQAIMGHAQIPVDSEADIESARRRFEDISESVEKASLLVHRLLAFRADEGRGEIEILNLNDVIESLAPMLKGLITETQSLAYRLDARPSTIRADLATLEQSLINLIINARDAMPDGGTIELRTELVQHNGSAKAHSATVRLSICDTGCGMNRQTLKRAFEPFFTTKGVGKGTGLGLAAVYNDLHRLGGQASLVSEPAAGTTVRLDFPGLAPVRREGSSRSAERSAVSAGGMQSGKRILLAEANPVIRKAASAQLRSAGHRVVAVANGEAAIQSVEGATGSDIDLLILDVTMPRVGGYNAFDIIRNQLGQVPVIFLNDQNQNGSSRRTQYLHLIKPFHREQLLKSVQTAIERNARVS